MQLFQVLPTIETIELKGSSIEDLINDNAVYLITDDINRIIYLYYTPKSCLRDIFVGMRIAKEVKRIMRGFYRIIEKVTEEEWNNLKNQTLTEGKIPELFNENMLKYEDQKYIPDNATKSRINQRDIWWHDFTLEHLTVFQDPKIKTSKNKESENSFSVPEIASQTPFLTIVNNECFNYIDSLTDFLSERNKEIKKQKLGNLPEGWSFFPEHTPLFKVNHGKIEYLDLYSQVDPSMKLILDIPLSPLSFPRITNENDLESLKRAFSIPEPPSIEEIISEFQKKIRSSQFKEFNVDETKMKKE